jgi:homoserine kinase
VPGSTANLGSGFDTFGLALQIYLTVDVEVSGDKLKIQCSGQGEAELPADDRHLVYRAIECVFRKAGKPVPGMTVKAHNDIPLSRGLGSSGAATVAGLAIGAKLSGAGLSDADILTMANTFEGHPENAASSYLGGLTINCVDEDSVFCRKVQVDSSLKAVLLIPEVRVSTEAARKVLPECIEQGDAIFNLQRTALLAHAFLLRDYSLLRIAVQDRLHQPYRSELIPGFAAFEQTAYQNGALAMAISGSGSTLICFTNDRAEVLHEAWRRQAERIALAATTTVLDIDNRGIHWEG